MEQWQRDGEHALLENMSQVATELIEIIAREKSGVRAGDGSWHGWYPIPEKIADLLKFYDRYNNGAVPR